MKLQNRELKIRMKGGDIALLQKELCRRGVSIPENELFTCTFGKGTREAVLASQRVKH